MNKIIVIKYGGSVLNTEVPSMRMRIIRDLAKLQSRGFRIVLVHGGSRELDEIMIRIGLRPKKINGKRKTDKKTLSLLNQCFSDLNSEIVMSLNSNGIQAIGFHGIAGRVVRAHKEKTGKLGFVGDVTSIDCNKIECIWDQCIPVISPLAYDEIDSQLYNINADEVAAEVAISLSSDYFILMTDVAGVRDSKGNMFHNLSVNEAKDSVNDGSITGGMIPKINSCINAITNGVGKAIIIKGEPGNLLCAVESNCSIGTTLVNELSEYHKLRKEMVA